MNARDFDSIRLDGKAWRALRRAKTGTSGQFFVSVAQAKKAVRFLMVSCKLEKVRASGGIKAFGTQASVITTCGSFTKGILCGRIDQRATSLAGIVLGGCGIVTVTKMPQELHMMSDLMLRSSEGK